MGKLDYGKSERRLNTDRDMTQLSKERGIGLGEDTGPSFDAAQASKHRGGEHR
jgi:hypothetical protein